MEPIMKAQIAHEYNYLSSIRRKIKKKENSHYRFPILSFEPYKSQFFSKKGFDKDHGKHIKLPQTKLHIKTLRSFKLYYCNYHCKKTPTVMSSASTCNHYSSQFRFMNTSFLTIRANTGKNGYTHGDSINKLKERNSTSWANLYKQNKTVNTHWKG
jgi:hypothetical protein